jgi:hypothetical protein
MHSHRCLNASASLPLKEIPRALCSGAPRYAMQMKFSPKGGLSLLKTSSGMACERIAAKRRPR